MRWFFVGLLLTCFSVHGDTYGDLQYSVANGEATITGYTGSGGAINIPSQINGLPVTKIGDWAFVNNTSITSVSIPGTVKRIEGGAFAGCSGITNMTLSEGLEVLRDAIFWGCSFETITLPNSLKIVGANGFSNCERLRSIVIPNNVTNIGDYAFTACTSLTNVIFSDSLQYFGRAAFAACSALTQITIPSSVNQFGMAAFANCTSLSNIVFLGNQPEPLSGGSEFENCPATVYRLPNATGWGSTFAGRPVEITNPWQFSVSNGEATITGYTGSDGAVTIPNNLYGIPVKNIGYRAFFDNTGLNSINLGTSITNIGIQAFQNTRLTQIIIPSSVMTVQDLAFNCNVTCTNLVISNGVETIGTQAFAGLYALTNTVNIPPSVKVIGDTAFWDCHSLQNVTISSGVETIGKGAFRWCRNLETVFIPASVTNLGNTPLVGWWGSGVGVFEGCTNLKTVIIASANLVIGSGTFANCPNLSKVLVLGKVPVPIDDILSYQGPPSEPVFYTPNVSDGWQTTFASRPVVSLNTIFTKDEFDANRTNGQNDILNNPNNSGLYTTNQIHNLGLGGIVLNRDTNNQLILNYQVMESTDLQNWSPYQTYQLPISNAPTNKMFLRVQAVGQ